MDWYWISTIIAIILAVLHAYILPKYGKIKRKVYLNEQQKEAILKILDKIKEAVSDGVITPAEINDILEEAQSVFETGTSEEIEQVIDLIIQYLESRRREQST